MEGIIIFSTTWRFIRIVVFRQSCNEPLFVQSRMSSGNLQQRSFQFQLPKISPWKLWKPSLTHRQWIDFDSEQLYIKFRWTLTRYCTWRLRNDGSRLPIILGFLKIEAMVGGRGSDQVKIICNCERTLVMDNFTLEGLVKRVPLRRMLNPSFYISRV